MIKEIVSDIRKALNLGLLDSSKELRENISDQIEESSLVWRKDYTIAVSRDESKTKVSNFMVCDKLDVTEQTFKVKREKDFWKKLQPRDDYQAVVECSFFSNDESLFEVETVGRDIMRSRKEVPSVALKGFVWVVGITIEKNLDSLFKLYFKENYITLNQDEINYYIGWTDNLKSLDMRHFICDPTAKKGK